MADTIAIVTLRSKLVKIHEPRRQARSFDYLREEVSKIAKTAPNDVKIDMALSQFMTNPQNRMSRLELKISKEGNLAKVTLAKPIIKQPKLEEKKENSLKPKKEKAKEEPKIEAPKSEKASKPKAAKEAKPKEQAK